MAPKVDANTVEKMFEEKKVEISIISNDIIHIKENIINQLKEQNMMQAEKMKSLNIQIVELKTKTEIDHQKVKRKQFRNVRFTEFH